MFYSANCCIRFKGKNDLKSFGKKGDNSDKTPTHYDYLWANILQPRVC